MIFTMLINVKTISRINTIFESFKARNIFIFQHFSFHEQLQFHVKKVVL